MSKIQIAGRVQYMPGIWGVNAAVRNASIEVIDVDPGGVDDVIWTGKTDDDGKFLGTSKEWQDDKTIPVWIQDSWLPPKGHWESKKIPDPTDLLLLKLVVKQGGKKHEVFPFLNTSPVPIVVPWGPLTVQSKDARALVILNNTADLGRANLKELYKFLEASGDAVPREVCGAYYKSITSLNGSNATLDAFCNALLKASELPGVKAVDAIINMHGSEGKMYFFDGGESGIPVGTVQNKLAALGIKNKLRLAYNTCCYGATHAAALCAGGFNTAIGSKGVNANSAGEYPLFLTSWVNGVTVSQALAVAQAPVLREPADAAARLLGFPDVNSVKTITGDQNLTIESAG